MEAPRIAHSSSFEEASALVVDHLKEVVPLGYWAVTRFDGDRQLNLEVRDDTYDVAAGDSHRWEDSFCIRMLAGEGPSVAPDAMSVPAFAAAGGAQAVPIGAYVGVPLRRGDGSVRDHLRPGSGAQAGRPPGARAPGAGAQQAAGSRPGCRPRARRGRARPSGGDEFAILASRITPDDVVLLVERIREAMAAAGISASVGTAEYRIGVGLAAAVQEADAAMYQDKARRRRG